MVESILFVDDESRILEGYKRTLRKNFNIVIAEGGVQALRILQSDGPFPVVVCDMQMPGMNGTQLLSEIKKIYPYTVRLMLTGNAHQKTAVDAINTGDVFRFLNKPCPPQKMLEEINEALKFHYLQKAEHELLEKTLKGSIRALIQILSTVSPRIFGHTENIKTYVISCAKVMGIRKTWELEATALLSQIGLVTLPDTILDSLAKGEKLNADETMAYEYHPILSSILINKIPRLEKISNAIRYQNESFTNSSEMSGINLPIWSRLLKAILDLVAGEISGLSSLDALERLKRESQHYDPNVLAALAVVINSKPNLSTVEVSLSALDLDMVIASDIVSHSGMLLVAKGQKINDSILVRIKNFSVNGNLTDKVKIMNPS
jgi:response regulator RpfG family c-di-GMP phosphodiesterase